MKKLTHRRDTSDTDASLAELVYRILPMATYFTTIQGYIEIYSRRESGLTHHALCSALRELLTVSLNVLRMGTLYTLHAHSMPCSARLALRTAGTPHAYCPA